MSTTFTQVSHGNLTNEQQRAVSGKMRYACERMAEDIEGRNTIKFLYDEDVNTFTREELLVALKWLSRNPIPIYVYEPKNSISKV